MKRLDTSGTEEQMEVLFIAPLSFPDISAWIISPPTTMNSDNQPNSQNQPNFKNQKIMGRPSWYFKIKTLNKFRHNFRLVGGLVGIVDGNGRI